MPYGHTSTKRTSFNRSPHKLENQVPRFSQSELEKEKDFLFGPWIRRVRRSQFEPSHADIQKHINDYLLRGNKITKLESSGPMTTQKTGTQYGSGIDSGSSILL